MQSKDIALLYSRTFYSELQCAVINKVCHFMGASSPLDLNMPSLAFSVGFVYSTPLLLPLLH